MMKTTALALSLLISAMMLSASAAEVQWNVFESIYPLRTDGINIGYYDDYISPELPLGYIYTDGKVIGVEMSGWKNIGNNVAIWSVATYGDEISRSQFQEPRKILYDNYNTNVGDGRTIDTQSTGDKYTFGDESSFYIALIGDGEDSADYYAWVELEIYDDRLEIVASALSYNSLYVGGGAVPEPTGGALLAIGIAALALRRKSSQYSQFTRG